MTDPGRRTTMGLGGDLAAALERLADAPRLLVASDFDGVLAPIVSDPQQSRLLPGAAEALTALTGHPATTVALVSGRTLADLGRLSRLGPPIRLVGSHGAQWPGRSVAGLDGDAMERLAVLTAAFEDIARRHHGVWVEKKPASAVLHTRRATPGAAQAADVASFIWLHDNPGYHVTRGKQVVDASVVEVGKGFAIDTLRADASADAVLYLGDDVTDEHVFTRLRPGDVGVKVGAGDTAAAYRVGRPEDAVAALTYLAALRRP